MEKSKVAVSKYDYCYEYILGLLIPELLHKTSGYQSIFLFLNYRVKKLRL